MAKALSHAPVYVEHRHGVVAVDGLVATLTNPALGIACPGYEQAHVQVVPSGGANPSVEVLVWSDAAGHFINPVGTEFVQAGTGVNTSYEFTVPVRSRLFFVRVTAIAAGSCSVFVAGSELDHER